MSKREGRAAVPDRPGKWWAEEVMRRYERGEALSEYAVRLAVQALQLPPSVIVRRPGRRVARRDFRALAAGDGLHGRDEVEVLL